MLDNAYIAWYARTRACDGASVPKGEVMPTKNTITINDYSNELSSFGVNSVDVTEVNLSAQLTAAAVLVAAVTDLSIGVIVKQAMTIIPYDSTGTPTSPYAQREMKWLVSYRGDSSGKIFQIEIPAPDITDNVVPNSDVADLSSDDWVAFVSAFESFARSPDDATETVTVIGAKLVGRNI